MSSVCLYLHVHQPRRVKRYRIFDIGNDRGYFSTHGDDRVDNRRIFNKVAQKSYLPTNRLLLELLETYPDFKVSFSITGIFLEQAEEYGEEVLESFRRLIDTGRVEIVSETYYHSLAFLYSEAEFIEQIRMHERKIFELFGVRPTVFRNTELIYNNDIARIAKKLGYKAVLTEGADKVLHGRSPNVLYSPRGVKDISLLLKNYKLSDDIAFRFSQRSWAEYPLTADKFGGWVSQVNGSGEIVNLFMDYETFGEHQWEETGIFNFLRELPQAIYAHPDNDFVHPSEAVERYPVRDELDVDEYISWADVERDLSAWLHNDMQRDAIETLYEIEDKVKTCGDESVVCDWRALTTSDHFYYMCTKRLNDGDVHKYFSPYESPYEAFVAFMNVVQDLKLRV